jgi:voltage-gated potassium channel
MPTGETDGAAAERKPFYTELPNGRIQHRAEPLIMVLALLMIPALTLEQESAEGLRDLAFGLNLFIWVGFAIELAFVLRVCSDRSRTLKAHWLDASIVLVSFPVMPMLLQGARVLRLLRLLRFLRLGLVGARLFVAVRTTLRPASLPYIALMVLILVVISGVVMYEVDRDQVSSPGEGIWWAFVTVTTVGYGDVAPDNPGGRLLGALVMAVGIGFYAVLTATIAATFVGQEEQDDEGREALQAEVRAISRRLERIERTLQELRG